MKLFIGKLPIYKGKITKEYLKIKWKSIPHVEDYINILQNAHISGRDINSCLHTLSYNIMNFMVLAALTDRIGNELTNKLYDQLTINELKDKYNIILPPNYFEKEVK